MRPIIVSQTGAGTSVALPLDIHGRPEISLQVNVTGTVTWTVEQTLDDPADAGAVWFVHPDVNMVSQTVSRQGNYAYVQRAVRLNVSAGTGTAKLIIIQSGIKG